MEDKNHFLLFFQQLPLEESVINCIYGKVEIPASNQGDHVPTDPQGGCHDEVDEP